MLNLSLDVIKFSCKDLGVKILKLAVFDFDSTLMDGETLEIIGRELGLGEKIKEITDKAMLGELDFFESLVTRVRLLAGMEERVVNRICSNLPLMSGARETIEALKEHGYKVVCFSGGFKNATIPVCAKLGVDAEFSNVLHAKNGVLTGLVGGEMMFSHSKGWVLENLQKLMNISKEDTLVIGDGANDLSMFRHAGIRVAFCAKPILRKEADIIVDEKNLKLILDELQRLR